MNSSTNTAKKAISQKQRVVAQWAVVTSYWWETASRRIFLMNTRLCTVQKWFSNIVQMRSTQLNGAKTTHLLSSQASMVPTMAIKGTMLTVVKKTTINHDSLSAMKNIISTKVPVGSTNALTQTSIPSWEMKIFWLTLHRHNLKMHIQPRKGTWSATYTSQILSRWPSQAKPIWDLQHTLIDCRSRLWTHIEAATLTVCSYKTTKTCADSSMMRSMQQIIANNDWIIKFFIDLF